MEFHSCLQGKRGNPLTFQKWHRISLITLVMKDQTRRIRLGIAIGILSVCISLPAMGATPDQIEEALAGSPLIIDELEVVEVEGITIVRGRVAEQSVTAAALAFVRARSERPVISAMEIVEKVDDATIERRVERALHLNENLEDASISVAAVNGVIELTGTVENELQILAAEDTAGTVREVLSIRNLLRLRS